jgi:hypothetical protein
MKTIIPRPIWLIVGFTLFVAVVIGFDVTVWARGGYGWRWPYEPGQVGRALPLITVLVIYCAGGWLLLRRNQAAGLLILWSIIGAVAISLAGNTIRDGDPLYALFVRTTSLLGSGPHWAANHIDWAGGEWRQWTEIMERFGGHMSNVPPGSMAWYGLLNNLFTLTPGFSSSIRQALLPYQCQNFDLLGYAPAQWTSSLFGMLMPLWAALAVIPVYAIARRVVGRYARYVIIWYALIPGLTAFAPSWSTLYPLFSAIAFLFLMKGLEKPGRNLWFFACGLITGLGIFVNFALIPFPLLLGVYVLVADWTEKRFSLRRTLSIGIQLSAGIIVPWLIYWLIGGQTFFDLLRTSMQFHLSLDRPYWFWLGMHLWDWGLFTGVGLTVLALISLRRNNLYPVSSFSIALFITMIALTLSGTARGETGRVWLFFSPFLLIAAADGLRRLQTDESLFSWLAITVTQAIMLFTLLFSLNVMGTNFTRPTPPPVVSVSRPADATFATNGQDVFRLTGWDARAENGAIQLRLQYRGTAPMSKALWFGASLVSPKGDVIGIPAWQPGANQPYPTTCWSPGQVVDDTIRLSLPANAPAGDWWISLAAYGDNAQSEGRLAVVQPGQAADTQIGLGPITIGQ